MYVTIADFIKEWHKEARLTEKVLDGLTDHSLKQQVYPEGRTLEGFRGILQQISLNIWLIRVQDKWK